MVEDITSREVQDPPAVDDDPVAAAGEEDVSLSALRDNIEKKKQNAYYYAHAHKADGPEWDGKIEPKLLGTSSSSNLSMTSVAITSSLTNKMALLSKSNITNYAFLDEGAKVKVYVELPGVGNFRDEDILLDFTETSLCLTVKNYVNTSGKVAAASEELLVDCSNDPVMEEEEGDTTQGKGEDRCLAVGRLYGEIEKASLRKKADKIIITMTKKDDKQWTKFIA